jgi:site-specific recombinase XerC
MSASNVGNVVARVLPDDCTCHTLRHRFASAAYGVEHDLRAVQELLGHAKPQPHEIAGSGSCGTTTASSG